MVRKRGKTVLTTPATPARQTAPAKQAKQAAPPTTVGVKRSFEKVYDTRAPSASPAPDTKLDEVYGVRPRLIQFIVVHDCRDCPHLHDYGPIPSNNEQQRRYGCLPLVLRKRAGEDIDYPFIELSNKNLRDPANWRPHPECPLGLGKDDA